MKKTLFIFLVILSIQLCYSQDSTLELSPEQSMLITGKGPGQDAAINPYTDTDSFAIVNNIVDNDFEIRIQSEGKIIEIIKIKSKTTKKVLLNKGYELYLDTNFKSKAKVEFEPKK